MTTSTNPDKALAEELRTAFFNTSSPKELAALLQVELRQLTYLVYGMEPSKRYEQFTVAKRSGGVREISSPTPALKSVQRRLNTVLQAVYTPKRPVHGFLPGRSIVSNAREHVGQNYVLNIDLKDFFPSINFGRVRGMFMAEPYRRNHKTATVLAQVCCAGEPATLPQGAPTSPIVSNMLCAKMDTALRRLAHDFRCHYTRYADDITISTDQRDFPRQIARLVRGEVVLGARLQGVIRENGFTVNVAKVRLQTKLQRQEVTGITTNQFPNVQRRFVRQVRAMLHAWHRYGLDAAQQEFAARYDVDKHRVSGESPAFDAVVRGKLEYLGMVKGRSDPVYMNLVRRARTIDGVGGG